jgi:type II secretory pathway pseudopilin PulG
MKITRSSTLRCGLTLIEVVVTICVIAFLASMIPVSFSSAKPRAQRINCVNNLRALGLAYQSWAGEVDNLFPADASAMRSGWKDLLGNSNQGFIAWTNYVLLNQRFINRTNYQPKNVVCPADERTTAKSFSELCNTNISYFIGVGAKGNIPNSILAGDRNLGPGPNPKDDYGFSPRVGSGNDVILQTNSPLCWSLSMHSHGNPVGAGNLLLGDGSVQQSSSGRLAFDYLPNALDSGNFPTGYDNSKSNSFRLIFP